jgi:hypothetical protein
MLLNESESVTGRDGFTMIEALATAIVSLEQLPLKRQPTSNMEGMKVLLSGAPAPIVSLMLAQAKCRIRPDLDFRDVYREYGIYIEQ